jgi:hypothetical protein
MLITANVINDDSSHDLYVTVTDLNDNMTVVLDKKRINVGESTPIQLEGDSNQQGSVAWVAVDVTDATLTKSVNTYTVGNLGDVKVDLFGV